MFAWQPSDIPGVPGKVIEHHLAVCPHARPVKQKVRKQAVEHQEFITEEIKKLEAAAAAERRTLAAEAPWGKKKNRSGKSSDARSGKRTSSECCATVEDAPSSSTGKCKKTMQLDQRPRKCPPRRMALVVPSPSVPLSTLNRKARSLLSCGRMSTCLLATV